jgi:phosphatidylinositol glycan class S
MMAWTNNTDASAAKDKTPANAHQAATSTRKQPPPEQPSDIRRRSFVILSFWLIVLCLGLPIWWQTTKIYRANLPLETMLDWADGKVCLYSSIRNRSS